MLSAQVKPFSHSVPPHGYFDPHNYSRWNEFKEAAEWSSTGFIWRGNHSYGIRNSHIRQAELNSFRIKRPTCWPGGRSKFAVLWRSENFICASAQVCRNRQRYNVERMCFFIKYSDSFTFVKNQARLVRTPHLVKTGTITTFAPHIGTDWAAAHL